GRLGDIALARKRRRQARRPGDRRRRMVRAEDARPGNGVSGENLGIDVMTAAALGLQVTFVDQQFVGERHGVAGDAELARENAGGRQVSAERYLAFQDRRHQHLPNLRLKAHLALEGEMDQLVPERTGFAHAKDHSSRAPEASWPSAARSTGSGPIWPTGVRSKLIVLCGL